MVLINTAAKVYKGATLASKVYRGTVQVWPPAAAWGPDQSCYTTQSPASQQSRTGCFGNDVTFAVAGRITGMRFYRVSASRTLRVWSGPGPGTLLGTCTTSGTGAGWASALFGTPIPVTAGQTVRAVMDVPTAEGCYRAPFGAIVNGDLTMSDLAYQSATAGVYPTTTHADNHFADVIFQKAL